MGGRHRSRTAPIGIPQPERRFRGSTCSTGTTDANGALAVKFPEPASRPPDVLVVSNGPYTNGYEGYGLSYNLLRWGEARADGFAIRIAVNGKWAGKVPVFFNWIAVWLT